MQVSSNSLQLQQLRQWFAEADCVLIGAGAGLSTAAGMTYGGERFRRNFADFEQKYAFHDMYSGGFYPFPTEEEYWAFWSRMILVNRYFAGVPQLYADLHAIVKGKEYFVLTTNVDQASSNIPSGRWLSAVRRRAMSVSMRPRRTRPRRSLPVLSASRRI